MSIVVKIYIVHYNNIYSFIHNFKVHVTMSSFTYDNIDIVETNTPIVCHNKQSANAYSHTNKKPRTNSDVSSSSSSAASSRADHDQVGVVASHPNCLCDEGHESKLLTVRKIGPNTGKKFYACPMGRNAQCGFFKWKDDYDDEQRQAASGGGGSSKISFNAFEKKKVNNMFVQPITQRQYECPNPELFNPNKETIPSETATYLGALLSKHFDGVRALSPVESIAITEAANAKVGVNDLWVYVPAKHNPPQGKKKTDGFIAGVAGLAGAAIQNESIGKSVKTNVPFGTLPDIRVVWYQCSANVLDNNSGVELTFTTKVISPSKKYPCYLSFSDCVGI